MATLTLDLLPAQLRQCAEMIDQHKRFPQFDESQYRAVADKMRGLAAPVGEARDDAAGVRATADKAVAGAFHDGMFEGSTEVMTMFADLAEKLTADAAHLEDAADGMQDLKARFFEIVQIYWAQAQYYGCKNPSSVDELLRSNTGWVLDHGRQTWDKLFENFNV